MRAKSTEPRSLSNVSTREVNDFCELVTLDHKFFKDAFGRPGCRGKLYGLVVKDRAKDLVAVYPTADMTAESTVAQLNHFRVKRRSKKSIQTEHRPTRMRVPSL